VEENRIRKGREYGRKPTVEDTLYYGRFNILWVKQTYRRNKVQRS
jgi:hypothetical protein